jgi:hypothetical protein
MARSLLLRAAAASAQFFTFPSTPAEPGELSAQEVLLLTLAGTVASGGMLYAGVEATTVDRPTRPTAAHAGFAAAGGTFAVLGSIYLPWVGWGSPSFAYTFVTGLFYSMAGVGIGGLAAPSDVTAPWLGGSIGLGGAAVYRGILSLAGQDDYRGGAAAQLTLGLLGSLGCGLEAIAVQGADRSIGIACSSVSLLAAIHGGVKLTRPDRGHDTARRSPGVRAVPVPWFQPSAAGVAVAGVF